MAIKVIDVSKYQGAIDWAKVKASGVQGAIVRVGYRGYAKAGTLVLDEYFHANMKGAAAAGVPVGVYFFSQAITEAEAREEARFTMNAIKNYRLEYPVYIDTEYSGAALKSGRADKLSKANRTAVVKAFCEEVERNAYFVGIYASTSWFKNQLDMSKLKAYSVWCAHYGVSKAGYDCAMWQYSSSGSVSGISGRCDMNWAYVDFPAVIKAAGLNGWSKATPTVTYKIGPMTAGDAKRVKALADELELECVEV